MLQAHGKAHVRNPGRLSPQDKYHLYFLFDLMAGGDLMDVLVAEAKVIKRRIPQGAWRRACFAPKVYPDCVLSIDSMRH